ncbi:MAG: tetratricopeptide repeat protein [Candidatus Nitrosocosmicus sp.]|nr:tetratricopeptide repeat protein [Candidatus Nitrosocosmicus sp.]
MFDGYASLTVTGKLLKKIVTNYADLLSEPSRFEGLLKDIYGSENKREIFLLTVALRARITEFRECNIFDNDTENKIYNMITRLSSDYGLDEKSAAWATIAWSVGFDLMTEEEFNDLANGNRSERYLILGNHIANMDAGIQQGEILQCNPISNLVMVNATSLKQLYENGIMFHNQGKFVEALECYDKALAIDPKNSKVLSNKGLSLHNQSKFVEALECYDKALAIDPQDEFIIKRRNNTKELLFNSSNNARSGQAIGQVSTLNNGLKNSNRLYFLGLELDAVLLTTGFVAYIIFGTNIDLKVNLLEDKSELNGHISTNDNDLVNQGLESHGISSQKESISEFTNNIEKELNLQINSENQSLLQNVNNSEPHSDTGNSQSKDIEFDELNGANQKVDNFKTELGKAMKSNFS